MKQQRNGSEKCLAASEMTTVILGICLLAGVVLNFNKWKYTAWCWIDVDLDKRRVDNDSWPVIAIAVIIGSERSCVPWKYIIIHMSKHMDAKLKLYLPNGSIY